MGMRHRKVRLHSDLHGRAASYRISWNLGGGQRGTHLMLNGTRISVLSCPGCCVLLKSQGFSHARLQTNLPQIFRNTEVAGHLLFHKHSAGTAGADF